MNRTRKIALALSLMSGVFGVSAVQAQPTSAMADSFLDYDGDGKADPVIVRNVGGGPSGAIGWWIRNSGTGSATYTQWGIATDYFVGGDYDGDGKADVAIWRSGAQGEFWIQQSSDGGLLRIPFGTTGDNPTVVGDFDGDGKTDPAIFRSSTGTWWVRKSTNGAITAVQWGAVSNTFPAPIDHDGDGMADYSVQINGLFWTLKSSNGSVAIERIGTATSLVTPGDWDDDMTSDIAVVQSEGGQLAHYYLSTANPGQSVYASRRAWGVSATDFTSQADYDGDGETDTAVWRPGAPGAFWLLQSTNGFAYVPFGASGDYPVANYNVH